MTPQQYDEIQAAFLRLRELRHSEVAVALADLPDEIRSDVAELLQCDRQCDGFLEPDRTEALIAGNAASASNQDFPPGETTAFHPAADPPRQMGPYRLLQMIGEGGFGTVHMAEQLEPVRRKVAIKVIKPGMDSKQVLARFHAERQALAMMDHPSIATVLEAGCAEDGSPYFVMELVRGIPINEFCEQHQLDLHDRLTLFQQVCAAVHHAHQKGVIHRDLKPSNILVAMGEGEPIAKVIDFGIAKALDARLTEQTLFTEFGQMIGTLEFMSPEQAEMSAIDIDTRSDVYSLGVVLFQLLTGETPISREELLRNGVFDIPRLIRETEHATPSKRLTSRENQLSRVPRTPARGVHELNRGDLDWITMKALAKDRRRRYDSARDLSLDVGRFMAKEAVEAHPPSTWYRLGKLARRHRIAVLAASAILMGLSIGIAGLVFGIGEARVARRQAEVDRDLALEAERQASESSRKLVDTMYPQMIQSAWQAYRQGDSERSNGLLQSCPERLRGWEWRFIQASLATQPFETIRKPNQPAATRMTVMEHRNIAAFVIEDGSVELRSLDRDEKRHVIRGELDANTVEFSPDGSLLLVGTIEGYLNVYRSTDWALTDSRALGLGGVYDIHFNLSGDQYALCTGGTWVSVQRTSTHETVARAKLPERCAAVDYHPIDHSLVAAGMNGHLYRLEPKTLEVLNKWQVSSASLLGLHWTSDHRAAVLASGNVYTVDTQQAEMNRETIASSNRLASAFAVAATNRGSINNGTTSAAANADSADTDSAETGTVTSANDFIAIGHGDGAMMVRQDDAPDQQVASFGSSIQSIQWLPAKERFLLTLADGRIVLSDSERTDSRRLFSGASIAAGLMLPKHSAGAVLLSSGQLQLVHKTTGEVLFEQRAHRDAPWAISTDRDQTMLVTVGEDRRMCCWELPQLKLRFEAELDWGVRDVCVSSDGKWIAAAPRVEKLLGQQEGTIGIWDSQTGECTRVLEGHGNWVLRMAISPDGKYLASASVDRTSRVWNTQDWTAEHVLQSKKQSTAEHVVFSGSSDRLYVGHRDGWVTSWNMADGTAGRTWSAFGDALSGLVADHDRIIATSRSDTCVRSRDLELSQIATEINLGMSTITNMQVSTDGSTYSFIDANGRILIRRVQDPKGVATGSR